MTRIEALYRNACDQAAIPLPSQPSVAEWNAATRDQKNEWRNRGRIPLVTIRVSPYITWQGPASRAAEAGRF